MVRLYIAFPAHAALFAPSLLPSRMRIGGYTFGNGPLLPRRACFRLARSMGAVAATLGPASADARAGGKADCGDLSPYVPSSRPAECLLDHRPAWPRQL